MENAGKMKTRKRHLLAAALLFDYSTYNNGGGEGRIKRGTCGRNDGENHEIITTVHDLI
jgi:hypothetical protein